MAEPFHAKTFDDFVPTEKAATISGLDYMLAILHGEFPAAPISKTMNYKLIDVSSGGVVFRGAPEFSTPNTNST
jgi:hypothetical protein